MSQKPYTHGGYPASQAYHWNTENHQKLGDILYRLLCGNREKRYQARQDFFRMKRHFMLDEWDEYIDKVDRLRASKGVKTLTQYIDESSGELFHPDRFNPEPEEFILPEQKVFLAPTLAVAQPQQRIDVSTSEEAVQLSLF